jgi:hypothetical protein
MPEVKVWWSKNTWYKPLKAGASRLTILSMGPGMRHSFVETNPPKPPHPNGGGMAVKAHIQRFASVRKLISAARIYLKVANNFIKKQREHHESRQYYEFFCSSEGYYCW